MKYKSTRGSKDKYTYCEGILKGIATDGGLLVPEDIPNVSQEEILSLTDKSYQDLATFIIKKFDIDLDPKSIKAIVHNAYNAKSFDTDKIVPIRSLNQKEHIIELWHGPTAAFKDMALQIMPIFFSNAIEKLNKKNNYLILVATSGDTGSAALDGFSNLDNTSILAFYPHGGTSEIQRKQMVTQCASNTYVAGVKGDFDKIQSTIKDIFNDKALNERLEKVYNTKLSSANSINWGRLLPQVIYHFSSYIQLMNHEKIKIGDKINIIVPSANFGNMFAAFMAKLMGLPIRKLISASNENNILEEFIRSGTYDISDRTLTKTPSPSMDIIISSNLERVLYFITKDTNKINKWMRQLKEERKFKVDKDTHKKIKEIFAAYSSSNQESLEYIKQTYKKYNYLVDTHTSIGIHASEAYNEETGNQNHNIIAATAHWSKFPSDVYKALNDISVYTRDSDISRIQDKNAFQILKLIHKQTKSNIHWRVESLQYASETHKSVIEQKQMHNFLQKALQ
jgi:threonine synthase